MPLKNIRNVGFTKGTLNTRKDADIFLDLLKQGLNALNIPFVDDCCESIPSTTPPGSSAFSLFFDSSNCISVSGVGDEDNPVFIEPIISDAPGNQLTCTEDGLYSSSTVFQENEVDGLLEGGQVVWSGTGLTYYITPATYRLNNVIYNSPQTIVTLNPADGTFGRTDVFYVDNNSTANFLTGSPAADPLKPQIDILSQIELTHIIVPAGALVVPITSELIYNENVAPEWIPATFLGMTGNAANTTNTYLGSKSVDLSSVNKGGYTRFTYPAGSLDLTPYQGGSVVFFVKLKAVMPAQANLRVNWLNGTSLVGGVVTAVIDKSNITSYQPVSIPLYSFNMLTTSVNKLEITYVTNDIAIYTGFYLDFAYLQKGIPGSPIVNNITADNGVFMSLTTNVEWGGPLIHNTTITTGAFNATFSGSVTGSSSGVLVVTNSDTGSSNAIYATSAGTNSAIYGNGATTGVTGSGPIGVQALGTTNVGLAASATSGAGLTATSVSGLAAAFTINPSSTSSVVEIEQLYRKTSGTALNGIGGKTAYYIETSNGTSQLSNEIVSRWTTVTTGSRNSEFSITGVNNAITKTLMTLDGLGNMVVTGTGIGYTSLLGSSGANFSGTNAGVFANGGNTGIYASSVTTPVIADNQSTSPNTIVTALAISRQGVYTGATGVGTKITFDLHNSTPSILYSGDIRHKYTVATAGSETSQFEFGLLNAGVFNDVVTINGTGQIVFTQGLRNFANDAAAAAGSPAVPINGLYRNGSITMIRVS